MKVILTFDNGCIGCMFNRLSRESTVIRRCSLTKTVIPIELIRAFMQGATLIDCPREINLPFIELIDLINGRRT